MKKYSIKDLERMTGIKAHTIRMWEKRYNILRPQRTESNIRYYTDEELKKLVNIANLNHDGYKISFLANLSDANLANLTLSLLEKPQKDEASINSMLSAAIVYDRLNLEYHLNNLILKYGLERGFQEVIIPLTKNLNVLLHSGVINNTHVYFVRSIIATKIIVATDQLPRVTNSDFSCLFFLSDPFGRELGMLFLNYMFCKRNIKTFNLGRRFTFSDFVAAYTALNPSLLIELYYDFHDSDTIYSHIKQLEEHNIKGEIWIQARADLNRNNLPKNVQYFEKFDGIIKKINEIFPFPYHKSIDVPL